MAETGHSAPRPDFYVAAMGRSGSTMVSNWLSDPPSRIVFNEPFFLRPGNSRLLRIQLRNIGLAVSDQEWSQVDDSPEKRFERLMGPRLAGRRWAAKEVLCQEHLAMLRTFEPPRVVVTVRNIADVALSFFEKHRLQGNLDRFSDKWVVDYCLRESAGLVDLVELLEDRRTPLHIVRYEDIVASDEARCALSAFTGWPGGGDTSANLADFDRAFEVQRHGASLSRSGPERKRTLGDGLDSAAASIAEQCADYQRRFGYSGA